MSILYQIKDSGGSGKCFFYSFHDSILSRENETTPKKEILRNIYTCFNIPKAQYDAKATENEKKDQFNQDIRNYLATQIRKTPSAFQDMAKANFLILDSETDNRALYQQIRTLGLQDINNYPGIYEILINPLVYAEMTANNELFELQAAGAVSSAVIQNMTKTNFYNLIADVLVNNNYSTYALQPVIDLLNYCLSQCPTQGYFINILFPTSNLQQEAKKQTLFKYNKDLIAIPVFKTQGAHYQSVVEQKNNPNPTQPGDIIQSKTFKDFLKDVDTILNPIKEKDKDFKKAFDEIIKIERLNKKNPDKQRKIETSSGSVMYIIPRTFFKANEWYQSIDENKDGEPLVGKFLVNDIRIRTKNEYDVDVTMADGTKTRIRIDTKKGHFVSYKQISKDSKQINSNVNTKNSKKEYEPIKYKSMNEFKKNIRTLLDDSSEAYSFTRSDPKDTHDTLEDFKKKLDWDKMKIIIDREKREIKGGYKKTQRKKNRKRKSSTRRK